MLFLKNIISQPGTHCLCRNFARHAVRGVDPGIRKRKKLLALNENEEDLEDMESDFMEVHKSHKQYLGELDTLKEREKYMIVKQKYFKERFPNFLTWHDKEQIRYLHRTDPEEWPTERLSEGFPGLPETIQKIVKSNWTKSKQNKITNHDAAVQKNWKLFKDGKMPDLPQELIEHLNKFSSRALTLKPFVIPEPDKSSIVVQNTNIGTEFVDIIKSYEKLKNNNCNAVEPKQIYEQVGKQPPPSEKYEAITMNRKKLVTLDQLQLKLRKKVATGQEIKEEEKYILNISKQEERKDKEMKNELVDLSQNKYQTTGIQNFQKKEKDFSHLNYPEKISIPETIHKKGVLYKLNDCYYDDDGEFLYRVPGMS